MKIQWLGNDAFVLSNKDVTINLNNPKAKDSDTFSVSSTPGEQMDQSGAKQLNLPGEFEISGILAQGFYTDDAKNIVYKLVMEGSGIVYFGNITEAPKTEFFEALGENTDIVIVNVSENFDDKKAKALITQITPRMAVIGGDSKFFPPLVESLNAKTAESNPHTVKGLSDDNTEVLILPV